MPTFMASHPPCDVPVPPIHRTHSDPAREGASRAVLAGQRRAVPEGGSGVPQLGIRPVMSDDASHAHRHHERTTHRPDQLSAARSPLDWSNRPRSDKRYRGVEPVALPTSWSESAASAVAVLSDDDPSGGTLQDLAGLARLLFFAGGVVRQRALDALTLHFRAVPSAGALYPVEIYVVCAGLGGLSAGVYHFDPVAFVLQPLRAGDWRAALGTAAADPDVAAAPLTVVLTGVPWRTTWKYGERGYRHLFWDAGAVVANLMETAAAADLPTRVVTGFVDRAVADLVAISPGQAPAQGGEAPLALIPVGPSADPPPPASDPPPRPLDVEPLSRSVIDEPALWQVHHAGDLADADEVAAWRDRLAHATTTPATVAVGAPPPGADAPLEEVILRRGSTRRFAHETLPRPALDWPLRVAIRHVPGDLAPPGRTHLTPLIAVHAVDGVHPGAYRHRDGSLALVHQQASRQATAELCLGQPLGGDAAYTTFFGAGLEDLIATAGDRAYRAAQLEAGVAAERLQLAAFAADAGATGLTFFDQEVRRFFATQAWPMLTVAVGVPAYRSRPGRRPGQG